MNDFDSGIVQDFDNTIFCTSQGRIRAIDISDSENPIPVWDKKVNRKCFSSYGQDNYISSAILDNNKFLYVSGKTHIYKIDTSRGKQVWRSFRLGKKFKYPIGLIDNEDLIICLYESSIYALQKVDGELRWKHTMKRRGIATATIYGQDLYVTCAGQLCQLNTKTGVESWKVKLCKTTDDPACIIHNQKKNLPLLFVSLSGKLHIFDTLRKIKIGSRRITKDSSILSLLTHKDMIYIGCSKKIVCLRQKDSALNWEKSIESQSKSLSLHIALMNDEPILFAMGHLGKGRIVIYSFRTSGTKRWEDFITRSANIVPGTGCLTTLNNTLCIGAAGGTVVTINPITKKTRGKTTFGFYWLTIATIQGSIPLSSQPLIQEYYMIKKSKKEE